MISKSIEMDFGEFQFNYRITGYFPEVQIFLNGEPLALVEIFPI